MKRATLSIKLRASCHKMPHEMSGVGRPSSAVMRLFITASLTLCAGLLRGETATQTTAPTSRLQQLEATYQGSLRKLHAPVLNDYLRELELLKQSLAARNHDADMRAVDAEIARVRTLAATTGVLPYDMPKKEEPPASKLQAKPPVPGLKKLGEKLGSDTIVLAAAEALPSTEFPLVHQDGPGKALKLGRASWKVSSVPAGVYDLVIVYAGVAVRNGQSITARFNGADLNLPLTAAHATDTDKNFRLARIGQITLDHEVTDATLTLRLDAADNSSLWLRSVILVKPKPRPKAEK